MSAHVLSSKAAAQASSASGHSDQGNLKDPVFPFDELATVLVGPRETLFKIHQTLLCQHSDFFEAALNGKFKENDELLVRLPEQQPDTFKFFVYWLYYQKLGGYYYPATRKPTIEELEVLGHNSKLTIQNPRRGPYWVTHQEKQWYEALFADYPFKGLIELYILADSLQVKGLRDRIISTLIEVYGFLNFPRKTMIDKIDNHPFWDWAPSDDRPKWLPQYHEGMRLAYEKLPEGCPLRRVLMLFLCDNFCDDPEEHEIPFFILSRALSLCIDRWKTDAPVTQWKEPGMVCNFHIHDIPCENPPSARQGCPFIEDDLLEHASNIPKEGLPPPADPSNP